MNVIVKSTLDSLSDQVVRRDLVRRANVRERRIIDLGTMDVDCQWLGHAGHESEAEEVFEKIVEIEQELDMS